MGYQVSGPMRISNTECGVYGEASCSVATMKKTLLSGIAALILATGTAHAAEPDKIPSTGPFWISALKISCGQKNGIWWQGMNGAGHFIRFYPSREETIDYLVKDNVLIVQGEPCKTEPFDCSIIGISAPGAERCGIALPQN